MNALRAKFPHWNYIDEPLNTWTSLVNEEGTNLLEVFYKDQRRWSYTFQNCAVLSRFRNIEEAIKHKANGISNIFITERCLDTDYHVFAKMLRDDRMIDLMEFTLYEQWFRLLKETATPLSAIVYIDTDAATCAQRIKGRGRNGEEGIPLDYLHKLNLFQNKWIDSLTTEVNSTVKSNVQMNYEEHNDNPCEFPCIRATTVERIEEFIEGLVETNYSKYKSTLDSPICVESFSPGFHLGTSNLSSFTPSNVLNNAEDPMEALTKSISVH